MLQDRQAEQLVDAAVAGAVELTSTGRLPSVLDSCTEHREAAAGAGDTPMHTHGLFSSSPSHLALRPLRRRTFSRSRMIFRRLFSSCSKMDREH